MTSGRKVMDALAVQETYFWREIDQLRALVDVIVPQVRHGRGNRRASGACPARPARSR